MKILNKILENSISKKGKTPACIYVLNKLGVVNDMKTKYKDFVNKAVKKFKVDKKELEQELEKFYKSS